MDANHITAVILTRDEERNLPRAITSLPHGMHVLVLDADSSDGTAAYARGAGATVIQRPWTDFVDARRFALAQVRTPWALVLDADEALDDVLRDEILAATGDAHAYTVSRTTYFRGKPMRMWHGERLLRLMRPSSADVQAQPAAGGTAKLHERYVCDGAVGDLRGTLLHYSYPDAASYQEKFARYTSIEAEGYRGGALGVVVSAALVIPRFMKYLLVRKAMLDGPRGWYIAWYSSVYPAAVAWKSVLS